MKFDRKNDIHMMIVTHVIFYVDCDDVIFNVFKPLRIINNGGNPT